MSDNVNAKSIDPRSKPPLLSSIVVRWHLLSTSKMHPVASQSVAEAKLIVRVALGFSVFFYGSCSVCDQ
jgi:hypothetical protein